jgi:hypothetical protein
MHGTVPDMSDVTRAAVESYWERSDDEMMLILGSHELSSGQEAAAALLGWLDPSAEQYAKERGLLPDPPTADEIREVGRKLVEKLVQSFPAQARAELCARYRQLKDDDLIDLAPPVIEVAREQLGGQGASALVVAVATVALLRALDRLCASEPDPRS